MKNLIKKNQLMITALAIMIAIAGYLQFAGTDLEDEYLEVTDGNVYTSEANLTGSGDIVTGNYTAQELLDLSEEDLLQTGVTDIESLDSDMEGTPVDDFLDVGAQITQNATTEAQTNTPDEGEIPGEAMFTSTAGIAVLSEAKLLKEQTRAKNKETLLEIINSAGLTDEQKQEAVDNMCAEVSAPAHAHCSEYGYVIGEDGSGFCHVR